LKGIFFLEVPLGREVLHLNFHSKVAQKPDYSRNNGTLERNKKQVKYSIRPEMISQICLNLDISRH
jgi:hypothetical protein